MIFTEETIWESCTKEEYDQATPKLFKYRRVPVYNNEQAGLFAQIELMNKEPDGWRYEKVSGKKLVFIVSEKEAKDEKLMSLLKMLKDSYEQV